MSLLGNALNLKQLNTGITSKLVNYSLAPAQQLFTEAGTAISRAFSTVPFQRISQSAPTFQQLGINSVLGIPVPADYSLLSAASGARLIAGFSSTSIGAGEARAAYGDAQQPDNEKHKVALTSLNNSAEAVIFDIMPEVTEVRAVEYEVIAPPQMPGEFQKYKGTKSVAWTIIGTLTAATRAEAQRNYEFISLLRSWTLPFFGQNQAETSRGAPPPVLEFAGWRGLVGAVPVVLTSLNWNWPKDVDWLPTNTADERQQLIPFPAVMNVNITIVESFSADQFNGFDLDAYRSGNMIGAYKPLSRTDPPVQVSEATGGQQAAVGGTPQPSTPESTSWGREARTNAPAVTFTPDPLAELLNAQIRVNESAAGQLNTGF